MAGDKRAAADQGAWLVFEDESGQGLRPPKGRTWGRRGRTPVVRVTGGSNRRVSLAALIAVKAGQRPRLLYRVHSVRHRDGDKRKGFTETDYARLVDAAHRPARRARDVYCYFDNTDKRHAPDNALALARRPRTVFTREVLLEQVWGYRHAADTRLVNVHVQRLRAKIEPDPERPEIILTVRGVGYKAGTA